MAGEVGCLFEIHDGDGDPSFFSGRMIARRVEEAWFPGMLPRGEAFLLKIESGPNTGRYIAITSRQIRSLDEQAKSGDWLSVVVHLIENIGREFDPSEKNSFPVGMAAIKIC